MKSNKWPCRACRKTSYKSESRAYSAISSIQTIHSDGHIPTRAYQCPYGNGWHLTSKPERKPA